MAHLTLAGRSDDGLRLILVDDQGVEHTLTVDADLHAALRGEHAHLGQLEIHMDSVLRPRDIQARIRAGETPETVAQAAQTTIDKIMPYASPVLAERTHVAQRAQRSSVRRRSGDPGARTLGEAVAAHLQGISIDPGHVSWDAWRRTDGRWTLTGGFSTPGRSGTAAFTYDMRGNFVTMDDPDAKWLVGEGRPDRDTATRETDRHEAEAEAGAPARKRTRRLAAVDSDELPLGEDAISLVSDPDPDPDLGDEPNLGYEPEGASVAIPDPQAPVEQAPEAGGDADTEPEATPTTAKPASSGRKQARKSRGRASVPSWDEIMFGGGSGDQGN